MKIRTAMIVAMLLALATAHEASAEPVGEMTAVAGRVDLTSPNREARPAAQGDPVEALDIVRTKSGARAEITFTDGSIIRIAPESRVEIAQYQVEPDRSEGILTLFRGKIRSIVDKGKSRWFGGKSEERRFRVQTPTMVSGVRGTDFFTAYQRGVSTAVFREGEGYGYAVSHPEEEWIIEAGEAMIVEGFDALPVIRPVSALELRMHLQDTSVTGRGAGEKTNGSDAGPGGGPADEGPGEITRAGEDQRGAGPPGGGHGEDPGFFRGGDNLAVKEGLREYASSIDLGGFEDDPGAFYELDADPSGAVGIRIPETGEFIPMAQIPGVTREDLSNYLTETWELYVGNTSGHFFDGTAEGGNIFVSPMVREDFQLPDEDWRIANAFVAGTYKDHSGATYDSWRLDLEYLEGDTGRFDHFTGTQWTDNQVSADVASAWVNWRACVTGVGGGKLSGAYNPDSGSWQGTGRWTAITTDRLFQMLDEGGDTLRALDIPAAEIGRVTLAGAAGGLDVTLSDVVFLGYATGGAPALWATEGVSGTFTGNPAGTVPLAGGGLQAEFSVRYWQNGAWSGLVENGSGALSPAMNVEFRGGAAGTFDTETNTFSGSAAGAAGQVLGQ